MISTKLTRNDLVGRYVRPTCRLRNGAGIYITPRTVCEIVDVVPGHGITIKTGECECCGMYAYMRGVPRKELELIEIGEQERQR